MKDERVLGCFNLLFGQVNGWAGRSTWSAQSVGGPAGGGPAGGAIIGGGPGRCFFSRKASPHFLVFERMFFITMTRGRDPGASPPPYTQYHTTAPYNSG